MLQKTYLSPKQEEILGYIREYDSLNNRFPTLDDIANKFQRTIPTVHEHVKALRQKGYLKSSTNEARNFVPSETLEGTVEIPLLGVISAGDGLENLEQEQQIPIQTSLLSSTGNHFALLIRGTSMIGDGILPDDIVIIRYQNHADNGDVVVALFNDEDIQKATLKRFYHHGNKIELRPKNPNLNSKWYKPGELEIRGKFISLLRKG